MLHHRLSLLALVGSLLALVNPSAFLSGVGNRKAPLMPNTLESGLMRPAVACPCAATIGFNLPSALCVDVVVSNTGTMSGECKVVATLCDLANTNKKCEFDFDVDIALKAAPAPCCEDYSLLYTPYFWTPNSTCELGDGPITFGSPFAITVPFGQHVRDYQTDCGKATGFVIDELCGGAVSRIAYFENKCCNCY